MRIYRRGRAVVVLLRAGLMMVRRARLRRMRAVRLLPRVVRPGWVLRPADRDADRGLAVRRVRALDVRRRDVDRPRRVRRGPRRRRARVAHRSRLRRALPRAVYRRERAAAAALRRRRVRVGTVAHARAVRALGAQRTD